MEKKKKILVLTDDMPWGHRSIAKAIYGYLKDKEKENTYEVEFREVKANTGVFGDLYIYTYRYFPKGGIIFHLLMQKGDFSRKILEEASVTNLPRVKKVIEEVKPDLVISAYFYHTHSLVKWRQRQNKKFKIWTIVADPWTINPTSFIKDADLSLFYDEVGQEEGIKYGLERKKTKITGWWTREAMYQKYDRNESRKKLGFTDDRPVIFVGGGSLGTNSLPKLLPMMLTLDQKVGFIINTGTDKLAYNLVNQYQKMFTKLRKNDDTVVIKHLGWIENMAEVLSACDIVFGKAGPNFLFDCVACRKPFVAITHIGGQEDGNIDLIRKKKLGWIKEENGKILDFMLKYLQKPKYYENKLSESIEIESKKNQNTLPLILDLVKEELKISGDKN